MKMNLAEFINYFNAGAWWYNPAIPQRVAKVLSDIASKCNIPSDTPVELEYRKGSYGIGPGFHYTYEFTFKFPQHLASALSKFEEGVHHNTLVSVDGSSVSIYAEW